MIKIFSKNLLLFSLALLCLILIMLLLRRPAEDKKTTQVGLPVDVAKVIKKDMPYIVELAGTTEEFQSVAVKSLVNGQIIKVHFQEGEIVKADQLLFEIDSRPFEYQLDQAEANLLRDQAQLENAEKEEKRYSDLLAEKAVSEEQYLQMLANRDVLKASIIADKAAIEDAKLQIEYCNISAPIDGRTGELQLDAGNLVEANSTTPLVVINTISPIYASFYLPEKYLALVRKYQQVDDLKVDLTTSLGEEITGGKVIFIDNAINDTNGAIKLKALFTNSDEALWSGEFVRVSLNIYTNKDSIVIPTKAVQTNQEGQYTFVVGGDNKVEMRKISIDFVNDDYAVVSKGLKEGEQVVTNGQLRLSPGILVTPNLTQEAS